MTFGLDVHGYSRYDRGEYCEHCDQSFLNWNVVAVDLFHERFQCPKCGHMYPKTVLSDYHYALALYLLSPADEDVWPEPLPLFSSEKVLA